MTTRELYSRVRSWTYFMSFGPGLLTPPSTLNRTSGSDYAKRFWTRSVTLWKIVKVFTLLQLIRMRLRFFRWYGPILGAYRHRGSHRGIGRATRRGNRQLKAQTAYARANYESFQLMKHDETLVGVGYMAPGTRAYRRLAWSRLNHEAVARTPIRPSWPRDEYEQVP
jgi:hypothetical protein